MKSKKILITLLSILTIFLITSCTNVETEDLQKEAEPTYDESEQDTNAQPDEDNNSEEPVTVEKNGIIIGYRDDYITIIKKMDNGKKFQDNSRKEIENKFITKLTVCGEDLKEYEILLQEDYGFEKDSIIEKNITFSGELVYAMFADGEEIYIDLKDYTISNLLDNENYEPVTYKGTFLSTGHVNNIGGQTGFTLVTEDGERLSALMGVHELMDMSEDMKESEAAGAYISYNLMDFTNVDVWVKGFKKKDSTLMYVTEFGHSYMWDETSGKWIRNGQLNYNNYLAFATLNNLVSSTSDEVIFEGTYTTLYDYDEKTVKFVFDKNMFENRVPNEEFINRNIEVYYTMDYNNDSNENIYVDDWYYSGESYSNSSLCYGTLSKVLEETSEYIEYQLENSKSSIKSVRFYKNDFKDKELKSLKGKTGYIEGNYIDNNLDKVRIKDWIEM